MIRLATAVALRHLAARRRQSIVSLSGIVLGVGLFLAIASLMRGSENDFIQRLVDNAPHITMRDEYRFPRLQPVQQAFPQGAVEIRGVKPMPEIRGIRGYVQILESLRTRPDMIVSPVLLGQAIISFAGRDISVTLNGMLPEDLTDITTIDTHMVAGTVEELLANPQGIIIGTGLAEKLSLTLGENIAVTAPNGQTTTFKIVGLFRTGRSDYDQTQTFADLKRVQALLDRPNRINAIIMKLDEPRRAFAVAAEVERRYGYKSISWQEASEDIMSTLTIRNIILYTVVSAVLVVAAFGIYNVISTTVFEKHRDIAILKSMGFRARDIQLIFLIQGFVLGIGGCVVGLPFGAALMFGLMQIRIAYPGTDEIVQMPVDWYWGQFAIASAFALGAALLAGFLPARRGAVIQPIDILRGGQ